MSDDRVQRMSQALAHAASEDPRLSDYFAFHRALLQVLSRAKTAIQATTVCADRKRRASRLAQGLPLISFDELPLAEARFTDLVSEVSRLLRDYQTDLAQPELPDGPDLYALAQRRFEESKAPESGKRETTESAVLNSAVDIALKPYLQWAAEHVPTPVDLRPWQRGYCPICGGPPDFAALDAELGKRRLLCSRCDSLWYFPRLRCPFCGTSDHANLFYYHSDNPLYRLYVCESCGHYVKTIDLREAHRDIILPVERITTVAMDAAARTAGYA